MPDENNGGKRLQIYILKHGPTLVYDALCSFLSVVCPHSHLDSSLCIRSRNAVGSFHEHKWMQRIYTSHEMNDKLYAMA